MTYKVRGLFHSLFLLTCLSSVFGQTGNIRGNVFDKNTGEAIIYGTIILKGTTLGATTDLDGKNVKILTTAAGMEEVLVPIRVIRRN